MRKISTGALAVGLLTALVVSPLQAGPIEGRWRLVEQHYGKGRSNLLEEDPPVRLEFSRSGGGLAGRLTIGDGGSDGLPWPAFIDGEGRRLPSDGVEVLFSPGEDRVTARYRVTPSRSGDMQLDVVEEYTVVEGGEALVGTVTATFLRDGATRGSFVLTRRFERLP